MKLSLLTGAYQARSVIANAQRCVNLYPEQNTQDAEFPTTHYPTPGLKLLSTAPEIMFRGMYVASNGKLYAAVGSYVYSIRADYSFEKVGDLGTGSGVVSMKDNGQYLIAVDGSESGYTLDLDTGKWKPINDDAFYGATRVDMVDGFFVLNRPGTRQFYVSLANDIKFDALDFAAKSGDSDRLVTCAVINRQIWLFGESTTEVWYNTGGADFAFSRADGIFMQHGCAAKHSVASMDMSMYWLAKNPQGQAIVMRSESMQALRISTHAIEHEFQKYDLLDDAIGFTHQMDGHMFYILTFPKADKTWCYDLATQQWHERSWMGTDGNFHRHRANCYAHWNGKSLVGDWENGNLYEMSAEHLDDAGKEIIRVRSFPHIVNEGMRVHYQDFIADLQVGHGFPGTSEKPKVRLRWSDSRGASWGSAISQDLSARGDYLKQVRWMRLGMARDRVFEISWSARTVTALNGAYITVRGGIS